MILAGDVGATNTRLALFEGDVREPRCLETYPSEEHDGLEDVLRAFLGAHPHQVQSACFGVAGPVRNGRTEAVNLAWPVDARTVAGTLGLGSVRVINDLEANAYGIAALGEADLSTLNVGTPDDSGNLAVIAAGTGLGEATVSRPDGHLHVLAGEGGHTDFAPRGELEIELYRFLAAEQSHVSYERVCSGMGLVNIFRFLLRRDTLPEPAWYLEAADRAAAVSRAALEGADETASRSLDTMISIYGAEAGNLALKVTATGGVYLGGGIAPKILPRLQEGGFLRAFTDKGRLSGLMERIPVQVILNDATALMGAAICATASPRLAGKLS